MNNNSYKKPLIKTGNAALQGLPMVIAILLIISLLTSAFGTEIYSKIFSGNEFLDSFIGALAGSFSFGNPIVSYVIGGELRAEQISLIAVTAFVISWVTVGIIQLPFEAMMLGKHFAIIRNTLCFAASMLIAISLELILGLL